MTDPTLLLWDIDHTLIETRGLGSELYRNAFAEVTGRALEHEAEVTGKTELAKTGRGSWPLRSNEPQLNERWRSTGRTRSSLGTVRATWRPD